MLSKAERDCCATFGVPDLSDCCALTKKELRRKYLDLSLIHHPDKGGDAELFKQLDHCKKEVLNQKRFATNCSRLTVPGAGPAASAASTTGGLRRGLWRQPPIIRPPQSRP